MKTKPRSVVKRTLYYYLLINRQYKWALFTNLVATSVALAAGAIAFRYYLGVLFDQLGHLNTYPSHLIWGTFWMLIFLQFVEVIFWRINDYTFIRRQARSLRDLEQFVFERLIRHSYRFFSDNFAGSLTTQFNRFVKSSETIEDAFAFELLSSGLMVIFAITVLLFIAPALGVALFIWSFLFIGLMVYLSAKKTPITRISAAADSVVTANIADSITNIMNIKAFARHGYETKRFIATSNDRFEKRMRSWMFDANIRNIRWVAVIIFIVVYLVMSIKMVINGSVSMADALTAQLYIMMIYARLFDLNQTIQRVEMAFADAVEMTNILDQTIEVKDPARPEISRIKAGLVAFQDVSFRYPGTSTNVMTGFNLSVPPGQKVGLVGHSGSGKSTLTRLLMRFSDLNAGHITIDGQDIAHITQDDLRSQIAFVPQEPILFHRSLMENIRYGRPEASDDEVHEAARLAHAADFIDRLPDKYQTMVGERGIKLSGGEKQRVAIARAMLSQAPILVLDEATSALDSKSEKLITSAMHVLMKDRTTLVIAHRLSTIRKLDRILVMKKGAIVEDGTHDSLVAADGEYAELWSHQSGGFIDED